MWITVQLIFSRWLRGAFIRYFSKIQASGEATELVSSVGCSAELGSHTILTILQWWKVKDLQLTVGHQGTVDGTVDVLLRSMASKEPSERSLWFLACGMRC